MKKKHKSIANILRMLPKELDKKEKRLKSFETPPIKEGRPFNRQNENEEIDIAGKWDENWWVCLLSSEEEDRSRKTDRKSEI